MPPWLLPAASFVQLPLLAAAFQGAPLLLAVVEPPFQVFFAQILPLVASTQLLLPIVSERNKLGWHSTQSSANLD